MPHALSTVNLKFSASSLAMDSSFLLTTLHFDSCESIFSSCQHSMKSIYSDDSKSSAYDSIFEPERNVLVIKPSIQSFASIAGVVEVAKEITLPSVEDHVGEMETGTVSEDGTDEEVLFGNQNVIDILPEEDFTDDLEVTNTQFKDDVVESHLINNLSVKKPTLKELTNIYRPSDNSFEDPEVTNTNIENQVEDCPVADTRFGNTPTQRPNALAVVDLENIAYLHTRLTSMGVAFTVYGEMVTYGAPANPAEFEQMLRLGPAYEEVWNKMVDPKTPRQGYTNDRDPVEARLWPDVRVLKNMLKNEGVRFEGTVLRRMPNDVTGRLDKLCETYRKLHSEWSLIACLLPPTPKKAASLAKSERVGDDKGFMEGSPGFNDKYDNLEVPRPQNNKPVNIGWRFSDDLGEQAATLALQEIERISSYHVDADYTLASGLALDGLSPSLNETSPPLKTPAYSTFSDCLGLPSSTRLVHGPSPLRNFQSSSPFDGADSSYCSTPKSSIESFVRRISKSFSVFPFKEPEDEENKKKKKGFRRWLVGFLRRKQDKSAAAKNRKKKKLCLQI